MFEYLIARCEEASLSTLNPFVICAKPTLVVESTPSLIPPLQQREASEQQ
jgi:hypothetical protein